MLETARELGLYIVCVSTFSHGLCQGGKITCYTELQKAKTLLWSGLGRYEHTKTIGELFKNYYLCVEVLRG